MLGEKHVHGFQCNASGPFDGETIGAGAEGGKVDGFDVVPLGEFERVSIVVGEYLIFVFAALTMASASCCAISPRIRIISLCI